MVKTEQKRFSHKASLQLQARRQDIKPGKMLKFSKKQEKEELWRSILPDKLMLEIKKREARLALATNTQVPDDSSSISMGTVKNRLPDVAPLLTNESSDEMMLAQETEVESPRTNTHGSLKYDNQYGSAKRHSQIWTMADSEMNFADQTTYAEN